MLHYFSERLETVFKRKLIHSEPIQSPIYYFMCSQMVSTLFYIKIEQISPFKSYWSCKNTNVLQCQTNQVIKTNVN